MYSMTGYGKGVAKHEGKTVTIELKTVNHRYLDYGIKLSRTFLFLEDVIKKSIEKRICRGHIDVFLTFEQQSVDQSQFVCDIPLAKNYLDVVNSLAIATGVENDITLSSLVKVADIITREQPVEDEDLLKSLVLTALDEALNNLVAMRLKEGEALKSDVEAKLDSIESSLKEIIAFAPQVVDNYRNQLNARIQEVVEPTMIDRQRLATEVALFADHCCIDEETTRLATHIANMRSMLSSKESVGRKMDFLVQEFNRETNTIGSKANDMRITNCVLAIKNDIEKIREQAANIE